MHAIYNYLNNALQYATTLDAQISCHLSQPSCPIWPPCLYIPGLSEEKQIQWKQGFSSCDWNLHLSLGTFRSWMRFWIPCYPPSSTNVILHGWNHHHCLSKVELDADNIVHTVWLHSDFLLQLTCLSSINFSPSFSHQLWDL